MSTVFENNINALRKIERNERLAEKLLELNLSSEEYNSGISNVEGKDVLYYHQEDKVVLLDTLYDSEELTKLWAENISSQSAAPTFMFFGLGNGMFAKYALSAYPQSIVAVCEPDIKLLKFVLTNFELYSVLSDDRFVLFTLDDFIADTGYDILNAVLPFKKMDESVYCAYPNYPAIFSNEIKQYELILQTFISKSKASMDVIARFGKAFSENTMVNANRITNSKSLVSLAKNVPEGIAAIIVSAGPSLDKNIELLQDVKGKCLIVATDAALLVLLKHGITPDLFVTVDAMKSPKHFADDRIKDIPVVMTSQANYRSVEGQRSPVFFTKDSNEYINNFFDSNNVVIPMLYSGGSVANDAASLCAQLGITTLIFIGQDLAYTGNKTHSADSFRASLKMDVNSFTNNRYVEGYYGGEVLSSEEFYLYISWFENFFEMNKKYMTFINSTEGGANIKGADNIPLNEAIEKYCNKEYILDGLFSNCDDLLDEKQKEEFKEYINNIIPYMKKMKQLVVTGKRSYDRLYDLARENKLGKAEAGNIIRKTAEISKAIEGEPVMCFINDQIQEFTNEMIKRTDKKYPDIRTELIETSKAGSEYMTKIFKAIDELVERYE